MKDGCGFQPDKEEWLNEVLQVAVSRLKENGQKVKTKRGEKNVNVWDMK